MAEKYASGFTRLARWYPLLDDRYAMALKVVKENFSGFSTRDGFPRTYKGMSEAQRRQVRRYYNLTMKYVERGPVYKMPFAELPKQIRSNRKNIESVMHAAQMSEGSKRAKHIFIMYDGTNIPKVKVENNRPVFVYERLGLVRETIEFNIQELVLDPAGAVNAVDMYAKQNAGDRRVTRYRILNGEHEFFTPNESSARDAATLLDKIQILMHKYPVGSSDDYTRWLRGVAIYYADDVRDVSRYQKGVRENTPKFRKARRKALRPKRK